MKIADGKSYKSILEVLRHVHCPCSPQIVKNAAQVLYLIVRRHREDSHHRVFLANSTVSPLMGLCWKLRRRKGPPAFFLDNGEDEMP